MRGRHIGATISSPLPGPKKEAENQQSLRRDGPWPPTVLPLCILRSAAGPFRGGLMRDRYMGLADPRRPEQQHVVAALDVASRGEFADELWIDGRLKLEVEALQRLLEGEAGHGDTHGQVLLRLGADLAAEDVIEKVGVTDIPLGGLLEHAAELGFDLIEPEPMTGRTEPIQLRCAHRAPPASTSSA